MSSVPLLNTEHGAVIGGAEATLVNSFFFNIYLFLID